MPQTVLCSSTRRKWWRRILRRRLCVDLQKSDTASVRLDGSTHDGTGHEQRAQSMCTWQRGALFFFLSGRGLPLEISADEDRVVCSCISIPIASSAMPKSLCLPEAKRSPLFSRHKGGEWRFCEGRPGVTWSRRVTGRRGRLGAGESKWSRGAWTFSPAAVVQPK